MAPQPPGLFSDLWHHVTSDWDGIVREASDIVHDKAVWEFISGVANVVATVAGLLALIPPLSVVFAPIALVAAGVALVSDMVLAGFDHGSWGAVILDAVAVVGGAAWIKAAGKLSEIYEASELTSVMTKAPTYAGLAAKIPLVTKIPVGGEAIAEAEQSVEVAPGMFRIIGASLKAAAGDSGELDTLSAVKDFGSKTPPSSAGSAWGQARAVSAGFSLSWRLSSHLGSCACSGRLSCGAGGAPGGTCSWTG